MSEHEHRYRFVGLVYQKGINPLPGSGACETWIYEKYVCEECLDAQYKRTGERRNTYSKHDGIHFDADAPGGRLP